MSSAPRPRDAVFSVHSYVGGESKLPGLNRVIKLSSNEGAFGPPPAAIQAMADAAQQMHRYPDGAMTALRQAIGKAYGLAPERIICGNGSDDILQLLIQAYGGPGTELIMSEHGFSIYEIAGKTAGCTVRKAPERNLTTDVDAILRLVTADTRMVFLANPNNPTGTLVNDAEMRRLRDRLPPDAAGDRRRLCRICRPARLRWRDRFGGCGRKHRDDADLFQNLRAGGRQAGLGLCRARDHRRAEPAARAVQCQQPGRGRRHRRGKSAELGARRPGA
jgi:hypothetical protein